MVGGRIQLQGLIDAFDNSGGSLVTDTKAVFVRKHLSIPIFVSA